MPAVGAGLDLDERVVRRHVARLEATGWLGRMPWVWGEGSVVWLTSLGLRGVDLGAVRTVKAPPSPTTIAHGVLVAWSAARMERRGLRWLAARELAADADRWAVRMRDERGYRKQLPDLAVWQRGAERPVAIVGEEGHRREDRQRMILEGWRDAIWAEQYAAVQYDCANDVAAAKIRRIAKRVQLGPPKVHRCSAAHWRGDPRDRSRPRRRRSRPQASDERACFGCRGRSAGRATAAARAGSSAGADDQGSAAPAARARGIARSRRRAGAPLSGDLRHPRAEAAVGAGVGDELHARTDSPGPDRLQHLS